ncbi:hypothetical protein [Streptosporangium sp. NPDC049644]|uniref:hypothetical protein n=1 Tax=Streptosporangium sp. NPDC049644 TaxID=3155507 RepID=UPI0034275675
MSVREIRDHLGRRIDVAHVTGEPTIAGRHGEPRAVIVSPRLVGRAARADRSGHARALAGTPARAFTPGLKAGALARILVALTVREEDDRQVAPGHGRGDPHLRGLRRPRPS